MGERRGVNTVIVVGAGVSGCACAAALAMAGHQVTLVNSAMDRVGLPAYGPDIVAGAGGWEEIETLFSRVPLPLRRVWLEAGMRPASGEGLLNIDRRRVSIESKRVLEGLPGLQFRQGFVVDLRVVTPNSALEGNEDGCGEPEGGQPWRAVPAPGAEPRGWVEVETVFGEVLAAERVVVAVGLSLEARTTVGEDVMPGGRYGEQSSDGLYRALGTLGAQFVDASLEVGPRMANLKVQLGAGGVLDGWTQGPGHWTQGLERRELVAAANGPALHAWPESYPPAPHVDASLRKRTILVCGTPGRAEHAHRPETEISPDGAATSEAYLAFGSAAAARLGATGDCMGIVASRMPSTVQAKAVSGLGRAGRMGGRLGRTPVWAVGRVAGAQDYLQSLLSGVLAAEDIVAEAGAADV
jgi:hypothetical protein